MTHANAARYVVDAQRLDAYHVALDLQDVSVRLRHRRIPRELRDQLERASLSVVLNIAEGAGRMAPGDKAHFFSIARGSASECGAILDVLARRGHVDTHEWHSAQDIVVRLMQMLTRLAAKQS